MKVSTKDLLSIPVERIVSAIDPENVGQWRVVVSSWRTPDGGDRKSIQLKTTIMDGYISEEAAEEEVSRVKAWLKEAQANAFLASKIDYRPNVPLADHFPLELDAADGDQPFAAYLPPKDKD